MPRLLALLVSVIVVFAVLASTPLGAQTFDYAVELDQSFVTTGCQGPSQCLCPVQFLGNMNGSFSLSFVDQQGDTAIYAVEDIEWLLEVGTPNEHPATGSGTFSIDETQGIQEIDVTLTINGVTSDYSSFGPVDAAPGFPDVVVFNLFFQVNVCVYDGLLVSATLVPPANEPFLRGDADGDGTTNGLVDGLFLLDSQFLGGPEPTCRDAADVDDDGVLNGLVDTLYLLAYSFIGGPPPPDPGPSSCGTDPTAEELDCAVASEGCP